MSVQNETSNKTKDQLITPKTGELTIKTYPPKWKQVREYYEKHPVYLLFVILLTIGFPFLGFFLSDLAGLLVGLAGSFVALVLGFRAVIKVREIREG